MTPGLDGDPPAALELLGLVGLTDDASSAGEAAIVTSIGSRSLPLSTVARKAFFSSSVMMYSRCVGTCVIVASVCPFMMRVGRTPYFSSQISETVDVQWWTVCAGCRAVSMTPMQLDGSVVCEGDGEPWLWLGL